jgi:hypothetical protein
MLQYMFIDESGDLGMQTRYLVLSALIVSNPADLDRIIKNMRRHKFRKQLRKAVEIKANKSSPEIKRHMLEALDSVLGISVSYVVLEKKKLYSDFLKQDKHKLYNYVAGKLAKHVSLPRTDLEIRIDRSKGKQLLQEDFNSYFLKLLREKSDLGKVEIYHSYSQSWSGLQFADLLAWSAFQKFEHGDDSYMSLLGVNPDVKYVW